MKKMKQKNPLNETRPLKKILLGPIGLVFALVFLGIIWGVLYYFGILPDEWVFRPGLIVFAGLATVKMTAAQFREYMAKNEERATKKHHQTRGHVVAGWVEVCGKRFYCRSKFEAAYAFYLAFLKKSQMIRDFDHEPRRFEFPLKRGNNSYLPDFRVTMPNGSEKYVEVKGWLDKASKTKLKRMNKYFPDVLVEVVLQKDSPGVMRFLPKDWPNVEQ